MLNMINLNNNIIIVMIYFVIIDMNSQMNIWYVLLMNLVTQINSSMNPAKLGKDFIVHDCEIGNKLLQILFIVLRS